MMAMWNPWRGCKKCSDGCLHCYIHKGDAKRNVNTNDVVKTKDFYKPVEKLKNGNYKMKSGMVYLCFSTDFLIEEADCWREECWRMIKERTDCTFLFLTKRIERFMECIPDDWDDGYQNVVVCCTVENQKNADKKLSIFQHLPIKHKCITAQPLLEKIDMEKYLMDMQIEKRVIIKDKCIDDVEVKMVYASNYYYTELNIASMLCDLDIRDNIPTEKIVKKLAGKNIDYEIIL